MARFVNHNGSIVEEGTAIVSARNRSLRYGDGVFETMRLINGRIHLDDLHFERLFNALTILKFNIPSNFTDVYLREQVLSLCIMNELQESARIRLNVFRKEGSLYDIVDHTPNFVIEASETGENHFIFNQEGLVLDVYDKARKSCDAFSNVKTNNFLPYTMAAMFAMENNLDDCLILNTYGRICDATIANVFSVRDNIVYTPPLSEGCIAGVMRRHLLRILPQQGYIVTEKPLTLADVNVAEELFLTNVIAGIRWVKKFQERVYTNTVCTSIYSLLF
jgi:branched-chain amino acid aminotransferase